MPEINATLLRGIERGERPALETLARQYAAPVYRYLVRLCADATLAEDLAQEVALQLWRHLPGKRFPNGRALNAWIYTVATNAYRMDRRRKRASEVSWDAEIDLPAGDECDPARSAEREDLARRVRRAVECLPAPEREALLLKVFSDLRYQEIATATGEPVGTVKWRISRAYERLRRILGATESPAEEDYGSMSSAAAVPGRRDEPGGAMAHAAPPAPVPGLLRTSDR
ncbi:MAG: RNA polymerase sigma factor [Armatimonadota bacterium]